MNIRNEKTKAITIVAIIIISLSGAFLYQGYVNHSKIIDRAIATQKNKLNSTISTLEKFAFAPYRNRIQNLINTSPGLVEAFARQDREQLYQLALPRYEALKKENKFFVVMHFHLPDSTTFLRMHNRDFFGDNLRYIRPIMDYVHATHKPSIGFEIGRHGPYLRVVQPVFYKDRYIGALEFGIKAHQILHSIESQSHTKTTSFFLSSKWQKASNFEHGETIPSGQYTLLTHDDPIFANLPNDFDLSREEDHQLTINDIDFTIHVHPFFHDFQGNNIGGILVSQNITSMLNQKKSFLKQGLVVSSILLLIAFTVLYLTFGSIMDDLLHEIDERSKAEKKLTRGQQRLQTIFDSSPAAIFIHAMDGTILDLNQTMLDLYGVEKEEGLTLSIADDYSSQKNDLAMLPVYWQEVDAGNIQQFEWLARRPYDGSTFVAQVNLEKIFFGDKEVVYATVQDITARKETEENLAAEQERLTVTLRSIGDGVIATDINGHVQLINKVAEEITGWQQHQALGQPASTVFNLINEESDQTLKNPVDQVLAQDKVTKISPGTILIAKDGSRRQISDSASPIHDRSSNTIGVVLVFRDITSQQKIEAELLKVRKLESIGILAGGIAHDFNNILAAILGNINLAAMMLGDNADNNKIAPLLAQAEKASLRARDLTSQLLTFAKGGEPIKENTAINELIQDSANFILRGSPIACHYDIPEDFWMVSIDKSQMSQVIQNIVINARHAMPDGGEINIKCSNIAYNEHLDLPLNTGRYIQISISDSGIGIPAEIINKIFDPYFSTKQEGSGLGLAVTHSIIAKHDGKIQAYSKPGCGTTFTIFLPASTEQLQATATPLPILSQGEASILIMDDEKLVVDVAQQMLGHLGYKVQSAADGADCIRRYQQSLTDGKPIDLIIMDLTIPGGMGGREAVDKILAINNKAKIIVSSGYSSDPVMANFLEYGFKAAVAKPFILPELAGAVQKVLKEVDD